MGERSGPEPEGGNRLFHWSGVEGGFVAGGGYRGLLVLALICEVGGQMVC